MEILKILKKMNIADIKIEKPFEGFFAIDDNDLSAIVEDMTNNGFEGARPITVWKGRNIVVDGHTRLKAAISIGLQEIPVFEQDFEDEIAALEYLVHHQKNRRNMTIEGLRQCVELVDEIKKQGEHLKLLSRDEFGRMKSQKGQTPFLGNFKNNTIKPTETESNKRSDIANLQRSLVDKDHSKSNIDTVKNGFLVYKGKERVTQRWFDHAPIVYKTDSFREKIVSDADFEILRSEIESAIGLSKKISDTNTNQKITPIENKKATLDSPNEKITSLPSRASTAKILGINEQKVREIRAINKLATPEEKKQVDTEKKSTRQVYDAIRKREQEAKRQADEMPAAKYIVTNLSDELSIITANSKDYKPVFNETNENINWAMWSFNPITGCLGPDKIPCPYCYARDIAFNDRYAAIYLTKFKPTFYPSRLTAPMNTKIPEKSKNKEGANRVFICSMADLFGSWVPDEWIQEVINTCTANPQWDFLFLTKNPERYTSFEFPLNCWLGSTCDTQKRTSITSNVFIEMSNQGINIKNIKFVSCEPLLEKISFDPEALKLINLVIIGALKGSENTNRQPKWKWIESLIVQCVQAGSLYIFKPNLTVRPDEYPKGTNHNDQILPSQALP